MRIHRSRAAIALVAVLLVAGPAIAQDAGPRMATRPELESLRDSLRNVLLASGDRDSEEARGVEGKLARVESRLRIGDFRPGDPVSLEVQGQPQWSGSFTVRPDQTIELPGVDPIPLEGVLYSEADPVIRSALAAVLRNPMVEVVTPLRVSVTGQVRSPGFYDVKEDLLISDLITLAGGPTQNGDIEKTEIRRYGNAIVKGRDLSASGLTLGQLGVQTGDIVYVPSREDTYRTLRTVSIFFGIILSGAAVIALF